MFLASPRRWIIACQYLRETYKKGIHVSAQWHLKLQARKRTSPQQFSKEKADLFTLNPNFKMKHFFIHRRIWYLTAVSVLALLPGIVMAQKPDSVVFYFANGSSALFSNDLVNTAAFRQLDRLLYTTGNAKTSISVAIRGGASIPGSEEINSSLAYKRAVAVRNYIRSQYPQIDRQKITLSWSVVNWEELRQCIARDPFCPNRDDLLQLLAVSMKDAVRLSLIRLLDDGITERYIINNYSSYMRSAIVSVTGGGKSGTPQDENEMPWELSAGESDSTGYITRAGAGEELTDTTVNNKPFGARDNSLLARADWERKPLFAVKTNLLFDAVSALNVEFEIPIGQRWSVAVEGIFPWWLWTKKQYCLEITSGNLEVRYWMGNRQKRDQMTGWFGGLYAGAGLYDIEWGNRGYQGEFLISTGLSAGYAHKIGKNWRMEYSLGVGYMKHKYREYVPKFGEDDDWHLIRQGSGNFTWIGPTRAKVSLVWMLNHGYQKSKGGR